MAFTINPIKFGTDGWRGVIAADFTFERVAMLAPIAAKTCALFSLTLLFLPVCLEE